MTNQMRMKLSYLVLTMKSSAVIVARHRMKVVMMRMKVLEKRKQKKRREIRLENKKA